MKRYAIEARINPVASAAHPDAADKAQAALDSQNPIETYRTLWFARRSDFLTFTGLLHDYVIVDRHTGLVVP